MGLRVLLVDDNRDFLHSVRQVLAAHAELEVVGAVMSGAEALEQVPILRPDLVLLDLAMPGMNGLEAARRIKVATPAARVIILTLHDDPYYQSAALAAGGVSMAPLPAPSSPTVDAIYAAYEAAADDGYRDHLGASLIGAACERALWYSFRWATRARHAGRRLRLFETGYLAEARFVADLRRIGVTVLDLLFNTGPEAPRFMKTFA